MSIQLIELIENFLVSELDVGMTSDALAACDGLTSEQINFISSHIDDWDLSLHESLAHPARISERSANPAIKVIPEDQPFSSIYTHPYNGLQPIHLDQIKRQLLFFPRVAVVRPEFKKDGDLSECRLSFKDFLAALLELREILEDRTIELTPLSGFYSNEIEGGAGLIRQACKNDLEVVNWLKTQTELIGDFSKFARRNDPYFDAGIRISSALTYGHNLVATHPFVGKLYARLLSDRPVIDSGTTAIATNLMSISLPGLSGLDWTDIRVIRQNESCFRKWRAELQDVIASVDSDLQSEKFVERFNSVAGARLALAALNLDEEIKKSSALARSREGAASFAIGAVAAGVATMSFSMPADSDIWPELLRVVEIGGLTAGLTFLWALKQPSHRDALRSHYSVFTPG